MKLFSLTMLFLLATTSVLVASPPIRYFTIEDAHKASPVVIIGTITSVVQTNKPRDQKSGSGPYDKVSITVSNVLKNTVSDLKISNGKTVSVSMPSNEAKWNLAISYSKGQTGTWFLDLNNGKLSAHCCTQFAPAATENELKRVIAERKTWREEMITEREKTLSNKAIDSDKK